MNEGPVVVQALRALRSVRAFRPDPLPQDVVDAILDVARWTGSSMNRQPWEFVVVRDRATLKALADAGVYTKHVADAALAVALVMEGEDHLTEAYDEGRLSERIMLAAAALGVGSCMGWYDPDGDTGAHARRILNVPPRRTLRTILSLGYPDTAAARRRSGSAPARKPLADLVHEDRYRG